jgi:glutamate transport system permease protein
MDVLVNNLAIFCQGVWMTIALTGLSLAMALPLGILVAVMRVSPAGGARVVASLYVEIVRNTPLAVVFFFSAFVLPQLGLRLSYFAFAIIALVVYYVAFFCEAVRSGINAVPAGQAEAARSIGMQFGECLRSVIIPQAARSSIPPLVNVTISLVKSTAVASAFGVSELLSAMERVVFLEGNAVLTVLIITSFVYLAITIPLGSIAYSVEHKLGLRR